VVTVPECVLRRSLATAQAHRPGLPPETKPKRTDQPTAARRLKAFAPLALPIIQTAVGADMRRQLTPWSGSGVQAAILHRLGWGTALYGPLEMQGIGT